MSDLTKLENYIDSLSEVFSNSIGIQQSQIFRYD